MSIQKKKVGKLLLSNEVVIDAAEYNSGDGVTVDNSENKISVNYAEISARLTSLYDPFPLSSQVASNIATEKTRAENAENKLSVSIDSKIYIDGISAESLSAIHVDAETYYQKVIDGTVKTNELYILSSNDGINCFDQRVINVDSPIESCDAANKDYVDSAIEYISKSHAELLALRDAEQLKPGQQYRIIDYVATTNGDMSSHSANHPFDIIVTADDKKTLNEHARAVIHDNDTYFIDCDLDSWDVWYCIDNDTSRFNWADTTNGKGVIYRLIDEFKNDAPYDFKGIQFLAYGDEDDVYRYTFDSGESSGNIDLSLRGSSSVHTNTIEPYYNSDNFLLNRIVFKGSGCYGNTFGTKSRNNTFGSGCFNNTFGQSFHTNTFGQNCYSNIFGPGCRINTFGSNCGNNTFEPDCRNNTFGDSCYNNTFGPGCHDNKLESNCRFNTFGPDCSANAFETTCEFNTFGPECHDNTFGSECRNNTFSKYCYSNTFGSICRYNTFKPNCYSNTFESDCKYNTFETNCRNNTFGVNCYKNMFGSSFHSNTMGTTCGNNIFGPDCNSNILGANCSRNTFGPNCYKNTFNDGCYGNTFESDCTDNTFESDCKYNDFKSNCHNNNFGIDCYNNTLDSSCHDITFGKHCTDNNFGSGCYNNIFESECNKNNFGSECGYNNLSSSCYGNIFGSNCLSNTFESDCKYNTFVSNCNKNTFGVNCYNNIFGSSCYGNTFEANCDDNTFGSQCTNNRFGSGCCRNNFGSNCDNNTFGSNCYRNTFNSSCHDITFGTWCSNNTFGTWCGNIKFGIESTVKSYCQYIRVGSGNNYLYINPTGTTAASQLYQNVEINEGVNNSFTYKTIDDPNVGQTFLTTYKPTNSQEISI